MRALLTYICVCVLLAAPEQYKLGGTVKLGGTAKVAVNAGGSPPSVVEVVGAVTNGTTPSITVPVTSTSSGDLLHVHVYTKYSNCPTGLAVTDSASDAVAQQWKINIVGQACSSDWKIIASAGVTNVSVSWNTGLGNAGGAIVVHATGLTASDQASAPTTTGQGTPWTSSSVTTTSANELLVGDADALISTYVGGAQNALAVTSTGWTKGYVICSGSSTAPCDLQSGNLDGSNGGIVGVWYKIVSSTTTFTFAGTNNGSTNTYNNFPGVITYK